LGEAQRLLTLLIPDDRVRTFNPTRSRHTLTPIRAKTLNKYRVTMRVNIRATIGNSDASRQLTAVALSLVQRTL
jgi:hypothetical protein